MSLTRFSVERPQLTLVAVVAMAALGIQALLTIPKAEDPAFAIPIYTVVAVVPGASPADIEQLVIDPVEKRLKELERVKRYDAQAEDGVGVVTVEFETEVDADRKYDEVVREMNALRPSLPAEMVRFEINRFNPANTFVAQLALVSETAPWHELDTRARDLRDRLSRVAGVKSAKLFAVPVREVQVRLDLAALAARRLPLTQALQALASEGANIPGGSVDVGGKRFNVKTSGPFTSLEDVRRTILAGDGRTAVRLGDVADVRWDYAEVTHAARYNGKRAVWVAVNLQETASVIAVRDRLWEVLNDWERTLPPRIALERGFDQSRNVSQRLSQLGSDFGIAILLVLVTLLPLGLRASAIVMVSIPLSLAVGVALLQMLGFTINQLTIVGFVIALGLLVDDSIVVVENVSRFLRSGSTPREAAVAATGQITVAVLGYTAALVLAFVPLLLLPGGPGKFIRGLPVAVVLTVLASLLVSLTVIPFLASRWLRPTDDPHGSKLLQAFQRGIAATYTPALHWALARPKRTLAGAAALFVGALALVPAVGFSLFPKAGTPHFLVTVETPAGTSRAATDAAVRTVERELMARPQVRSVFANIGRGNPETYYNVIPAGERPNAGEVLAVLDRYDPAATPRMFDSLRRTFEAVPGARIQVKEFENGPPIEAPIAVRITGPNLDTLQQLAAQLERLIAAQPGTRSVVNPLAVPRTDLRMVIQRDKAGLVGVPTAEVDRTVRLALAGLPGATLRGGDGREYDVRVTVPGAAVPTPAMLERVFVPSVTGAAVPLGQLATARFETSPPVIQHTKGQRSVTVTSDVRTGFNTGKVTDAILDSVSAWQRPAGYDIIAAGEVESREESFGGLGTAILVAVFGILAVLVLEFRTFTGTLIVASVIPLGVVGAVGALFLTGYTLSFTAMVGIVALIGIEIKNSVLLVDYTNQLREQGVPLDEAIETAGAVRFLPIVLTSLTAIGGLLPLALQGSSLYSPLAVVIIGGLVSSTVLARIVTPVMYRLIPPAVGAPAPSIATRQPPQTAASTSPAPA
jgi:multidrug efflux pump subunit AcrB